MSHEAIAVKSERLDHDQMSLLEKYWLMTQATDYSETKRTYWFARKRDSLTVKIPAGNATEAWYALSQIEDPENYEFAPDEEARLFKARGIQERIEALQDEMLGLLEPTLESLKDRSIEELSALMDKMPTRESRVTVQIALITRRGEVAKTS